MEEEDNIFARLMRCSTFPDRRETLVPVLCDQRPKSGDSSQGHAKGQTSLTPCPQTKAGSAEPRFLPSPSPAGSEEAGSASDGCPTPPDASPAATSTASSSSCPVRQAPSQPSPRSLACSSKEPSRVQRLSLPDEVPRGEADTRMVDGAVKGPVEVAEGGPMGFERLLSTEAAIAGWDRSAAFRSLPPKKRLRKPEAPVQLPFARPEPKGRRKRSSGKAGLPDDPPSKRPPNPRKTWLQRHQDAKKASSTSSTSPKASSSRGSVGDDKRSKVKETSAVAEEAEKPGSSSAVAGSPAKASAAKAKPAQTPSPRAKARFDDRFNCADCGASYGLKHNLMGHIRQVHWGQSLYRCRQRCGQGFGASYSRLKHEQTCQGPSPTITSTSASTSSTPIASPAVASASSTALRPSPTSSASPASAGATGPLQDSSAQIKPALSRPVDDFIEEQAAPPPVSIVSSQAAAPRQPRKAKPVAVSAKVSPPSPPKKETAAAASSQAATDDGAGAEKAVGQLPGTSAQSSQAEAGKGSAEAGTGPAAAAALVGPRRYPTCEWCRSSYSSDHFLRAHSLKCAKRPKAQR